MLSLAFLFRPFIVPPVDRSGLTSPEAPTVEIAAESVQAIDLLSAVVGIQDIDQKLVAEGELHQKMIEMCGTLLEEAHYDKSGYADWAANASWRPR